jgi:hypothetical protein
VSVTEPEESRLTDTPAWTSTDENACPTALMQRSPEFAGADGRDAFDANQTA